MKHLPDKEGYKLNILSVPQPKNRFPLLGEAL